MGRYTTNQLEITPFADGVSQLTRCRGPATSLCQCQGEGAAGGCFDFSLGLPSGDLT